MGQFTLAMVLVTMTAGIALADPPLAYKLDAFVTDVPRLVGDEDIGTIRSGGFRFYADDPKRHTLLLGIEYAAFTNRFTAPTTLVVPEHTFNLGANLPLPVLTGVRLATSNQQCLNDDPYATFGIYPYRRFASGSAELGVEQDVQHRMWVFGLGTIMARSTKLIVGSSLERLPRDRGSTDTKQQGRIGAAALVPVPHSRLDLFGGGNYCLDDERFVWLGGLSLNANVRGNGMQPAALFAHRHRPDSHYTLAIFTLWGKTLHPRVTQTIHEAFFRGGLKETRIVGGRTMGDPGLGSQHEMVDFGGFAIALSNLVVDAGDVTLLERDLTAYATLPWTSGLWSDPVLGVTYGEVSDLVFNPSVHGMDDPLQHSWEYTVGVKVQTHAAYANDARLETSTTRVWLALDTRGGVRLKATTWF